MLGVSLRDPIRKEENIEELELTAEIDSKLVAVGGEHRRRDGRRSSENRRTLWCWNGDYAPVKAVLIDPPSGARPRHLEPPTKESLKSNINFIAVLLISVNYETEFEFHSLHLPRACWR
ncbi:jg12907 [Pararge aegeria aegeria]|uniref:Jg12907 protein n=1 Tax=Pararge aegeria aegeria TaxID=348720 RepID=A0A8S4R0U4_9NEOP|nr:jg12907 [Pararge aegeria aegeria]